MCDIEKLSAAEREEIWRDPKRYRKWARQQLEERWQRRERLKKEFADDWEKKTIEANARRDLGVLQPDIQKFDSLSDDDKAYFLREGRRIGLFPAKIGRDRRDPKIVEAIEDEKFIYQRNIRVFGVKYHKDEVKASSVRQIAADFHDRSPDQLDNLEKNANRKSKPKSGTDRKKRTGP
jgi:hypothetical protein